MKQIDIAVIGGSAAGVAAAITARRHYPSKSILLIRKEKQIPIPCGIPYIFGTVGDPQKNLIAVSACISRKMTADDIAMFQVGTHPALTASPIAYQLVNAAEFAAMKMRVAAN